MTVFDANTFLVRPRHPPPLPPDSHIYASDVRLVPPLSGFARRRPRGVRRLGLAYEQRVTDVLSAIYGDRYRASPTIQYSRHGRRRFAIPDGILYWNDLAIVVEVKLAHTELVWDQLIEKYRPLVRLLHPTLRVRCVEICRTYDPAINVPHTRITSLHSGCSPGLEVMLWRI